MAARSVFAQQARPQEARPRGAATGLLAKAVVAIGVCFLVRMLAAQAPASSDGVIPEEVDAQGYKIQVPLPALSKGPKARSEEQKYRSAVRQILAGTTSLTADPSTRRSFRGYFLQYLFPLMTTEEGQKSIGNDRQSFLRDLQNAKSKEAHAELNSITLPAMQKIVQDPAYRLAARYNAMLIISSLNEQEANSTSVPQALPEPMPSALGFILQQYRKEDNHDSIKVAALIGLARHLEFDSYKQPPSTPMPPAGKDAIVKDLTELAEAKQPPEGRASEVHSWMRRRAIEGLSFACLTKPNAAIAATIEKLLKDESDTLKVRLAAASALGRMSLQPPVKLDAVATAKELGYLALVACDAELTRAETNRKNEAEHEARLAGTYSAEIDYSGAGGGAMGSAGGMPGMGGMPGSGYRGSGDGYGGLGGIRRPVPGSGPGGISDGGSEYGMAGGAMDPSMMDPKHYRVEYLRRKIRQNLFAVQQGLAGNDDFVPPRTTTKTGNQGSNPQIGASKSGAENTAAGDKRGVHAIAKPGAEQDAVKEVYYKVRRLAEIIEVAGTQVDFYQLVKDLRQELRPLEAITKRLQPAAAANAVADNDEGPSMPSKKGPAGKVAPKLPPGKGNPVKAAPAPAGKGKAAWRPPTRPQPSVMAKPRVGR